MEKIDIKLLLESLKDEDIIELVTKLGAHTYINNENSNYIIFPTICHNENSEDASMKLYYYKNTHLFVCYTECDDSFNIFGLYEKVYKLHNKQFSFSQVLYSIVEETNLQEYLISFKDKEYKSIKDKYKQVKRAIELQTFDDSILQLFTHYYPIEWISDGISKESMDKFNILYSISRNKIIIPHYDINHNLIGIRGRALNHDEAELYGKYMPLQIEGKSYAHPLSLNLYGINVNKENIKKKRKVIIAEGEKSVLQCETMFGSDNICVAACGSAINKGQINILIKNFDLDEIILAFDKEYVEFSSIEGRRYLNKLESMCKKYINYCNFSFIYDKNNLLKEKESPFDRGKEIFLQLYNNRIQIRSM